MVDRDAIARQVGFILEQHGQPAAREILREAIIRIGLQGGLTAGIKTARDIADELEGPDPLLL